MTRLQPTIAASTHPSAKEDWYKHFQAYQGGARMTKAAYARAHLACSVDGAHALCNHLSLIRTAKLHRLDPYHYLTEIFRRLVHCQTLAQFEALLSWNIKLPQPHFLKTA